MSEEQLAPKLRFTDEEIYVRSTLENIAKVTGGKRMPKGFSLINEPNNHPYITVSNMNNDFEDLSTYQYVPTEICSQIKNYIVDENDLIISVAGTLGLVKKVPKCLNKANLTENANRISEIKIDIDYLQYYLNTTSIQNRILAVQTNNAQPKLALKEIRNFKITYPSIVEQKKVSGFLSLIDNKLNLLEKKHESYVDFKKYLMQNIFAQELRFADDEDWVTVTVDDLFDNITDYVAAGSFADIRKNVTYLKNPDYAQLIRTADLKSEFKNGDFVYVDKHAFEYLWRVNLDEPCIILPNIGNIGEVYYVNPKELPYGNNALAPNAILLKSNDNIKFKYYLFESQYFKNQLDIINEAGGRGKFNKTNLKKIKIKVPNNNLEKEKIANCLSSVDNKLKLFNIQLIETQDFKKGLLQQMFV